MKPRELERGDVVQLDDTHNERFAACLMIVTEPKPWGAQGCVIGPDAPRSAQFYVRVEWEHMEYVGRATWMPA